MASATAAVAKRGGRAASAASTGHMLDATTHSVCRVGAVRRPPRRPQRAAAGADGTVSTPGTLPTCLTIPRCSVGAAGALMLFGPCNESSEDVFESLSAV